MKGRARQFETDIQALVLGEDNETRSHAPAHRSVIVSVGLFALVSDSVTAAKFGEWSAPVNLGPVVNSGFDEVSPHLSKNGLSLYLASTRSMGRSAAKTSGVSRRTTDDDPWGLPANLGPLINAS